MDDRDWPINQIARLGGTTSRTLRHYDDIGLVKPSRIGHNGYRYYDREALVRLQRVLLLRDLGLSLSQIAEIVSRRTDESVALADHLDLLRGERARLDRRIAAVELTISALREDTDIMAEDMLDGFDPSDHREEVEQRWGADAYRQSNDWWQSMSDHERSDWRQQSEQLRQDWIEAAGDPSIAADSVAAQQLAQRHVAWLASIPGTPAANPAGDADAYIRGLADMYVADERFAANYSGRTGAEFVRAALLAHLDGLD
ncbi:MAG: hypothetical protein RLZ55_440 [Actinomycetota bacterium]